MKKLFITTFVLLTAFVLAAKPSQAAVCTMSFDVNMHWFADQARNTYANPSMYAASRYQFCPDPVPNTDTGTCWMYRQYCSSTQAFTVFNQIAPYYHMMFDDPTINCVNAVGFGRKASNGLCASANWGAEPRTLLTLYGRDAWVEIAQKQNGNYLPFKLISLTLGNSQAIQLWYKQRDGRVMGWSSLAGNTTWDFDIDVVTVWVGSVSRQGGFMIKNFVADSY